MTPLPQSERLCPDRCVSWPGIPEDYKLPTIIFRIIDEEMFTDLEEDDDSGWRVVVLAVGVHQADCVHQRGKQRSKLVQLC